MDNAGFLDCTTELAVLSIDRFTPPVIYAAPKAILSEQFDVEEDQITPETTLADDLGADSVDVVDLLMSIEDEFEVEIPDEEVENIKTVGALVEYIESHSNV